MKKLLASLLVLLVLVGGSLFIYPKAFKNVERTSTETTQETPVPSNVTSRILVVGDSIWGRYIEVLSNKSPLGYAWTFSRLDELEPEKYDAWAINVECPITDKNIPFETQVSTLTFNCRPEFLDEFKKWFDIVSFANNHSDNGGVEGLLESRERLTKAGIQHFGHYDLSESQDACEVVEVSAKQENSDQKVKLPIAFCGYNNVFRDPSDEELAGIKEYSKYFFTIVMPQMGVEYQDHSDELKEKTYRKMIDLGADSVIASHPHYVQNTEVYKGKLIAYSIGNFIFDQNFELDVSRGATIDLLLSLDSSELDRYESLKNCKKYKDNCLKSALVQNIIKPNFKVEYKMIGVEATDYLLHKAGKETQKALEERMNWEKTLKQLR